MSRSIMCMAFVATVLICACAPGDAPDHTPQSISGNAAEEIFETVWTTFDRRYALFGARSVDWQALYEVYRPMVGPETTDEELFDVLTAMLSHLNDTHVMLQAESLGRDFSAGYL